MESTLTQICEADVRRLIGAVDRLVMQELVRTKASVPDLRDAWRFASGPTASDAKAYRALPLRLRRLVDLLSVELDSRLAAETDWNLW